MNYAITDIQKIKRCPKCRRYKPGRGDKCLCGFDWQEKKPTGRITRLNPKNIPQCKHCNAEGNQPGGLCEKHAKVAELRGGIIHWLGFRNGENKNDLDVCRQVDNFVVVILNTLELDDKLQKGWVAYRQKNLEKIKKLMFEKEIPEIPKPEEEASDDR